MPYKFSQRSLQRLSGVHPDLVRVMQRAISLTEVDFTVLEGLRTLERQKQLLRQGATTTLNSRHLTGHAVDIAPFINGQVSWHWPHYHALAPFVWKAAEIEGVKGLEWGGNWKSFPDGPHWQLSWKDYPVK